MLDGDEPQSMTPWFKGFRGTIEMLDHQRYVMNGEISEISDTKLEITELPVRTWTQTYKEQVSLFPMLLFQAEIWVSMISLFWVRLIFVWLTNS